MLIKVKNKDTLIAGSFKFKCCVGKNGTKKHKTEGDYSTPKGTYSLGPIYYRKDREKKPSTTLKIFKIRPNMGWCNDPKNKFYNKEILINKKIKCEKLFRKDHKYDYFILIKYNYKKTIKNKGSAIFIHLTKNYKPTAGCISISKKDFLILIKLIDKNTKILIN